MLVQLSIANYAIIKSVELKLSEGLTVITGETGAGKSIILGALSLLLGKRADTSVLNNKDEKCIVEGVFKLNSSFQNFFNVNDLDFDEDTTIRREINAKGKSRAFINDTPVSLTVLKDLTESLVDIHSQHHTQKVNDTKFQIAIVDTIANTKKELSNYQKLYANYIVLLKELEEFKVSNTLSDKDLDYIKFQLQELNRLKLNEGEIEQLEQEVKLINNVEQLTGEIGNAINCIESEEVDVVDFVNRAALSLSKLSSIDNEFDELSKRLSSASIELADVVLELKSKADSFNFDNNRAQEVQERLNAIYLLQRKHNILNFTDFKALQLKLENKINDAENFDLVLNRKQSKLLDLKQELTHLAKIISNKRKSCLPTLNQNVESIVNNLGIENAQFEVQIAELKQLNKYGLDEVNFLFTANKGYELQDLNKSASGGELSRVMLALKSLIIDKDSFSTVIFDEIDTGVSGDVADMMGGVMKKMAKSFQIIAITHLPQVASKGNNHFIVYKEEIENITKAQVKQLNKKERVEELAKMLSGKKITPAALHNAKSLLELNI